MSVQAICFQQPLAPSVNGSGVPYASGSVGFYTTGTLNTLAVYSDAGLSVALPNPVPLNASGYTSTTTTGSITPVYLQAQTYDYYLYDVNGTTIYGPVTIAGSQWPGQLQEIATLSPAANANGYANRLQSTINKASSGTHALFAGTRFDPPTIGAGASTLTEADTVYVGANPSGATSNYAMHVVGDVKIDGTLTAPNFTPAITLLKANSGTSTSTGATNVDTIALSGLTANDTIVVYYSAQAITQAVAGMYLYSSTDSAQLQDLTDQGGAGNLPASKNAIGQAVLRQAQTANTLILGMANAWRTDNSALSTGGGASVSTSWQASWTLALHSGGVAVAGGTLAWTWAVYKIAGQ